MRQSAKGVVMLSQLASGLSPCMLPVVFVRSVVGYGPLFCRIAKNQWKKNFLVSLFIVGHT